MYEQVHQQIRTQILSRALKPDDPLPAIRTIARQLQISVITVRRAWELLEADGLISTAVGRGSFVAKLTDQDIDDLRRALARDAVSADVARYKSWGLTADEVSALVREQYRHDERPESP